MSEISKNDRNLMSFLQKDGRKSVAELAELMDVTETAIRQRLNRLIALGLISRDEEKLSRGRPVHKYSVTKQGRASAGENFSELAAVVWDEVRSIDDKEIRSQVIRGIAKRLAAKYRQEIEDLASPSGQPLTVQERAKSIASFFESRGIPVTVDTEAEVSEALVETHGSNSPPTDAANPLPVLRLHGCPYPGLSDGDELICEMEQSMFAELAGCDVELNRCDRNGQSECCSFQLESDPLAAGDSQSLAKVADGDRD